MPETAEACMAVFGRAMVARDIELGLEGSSRFRGACVRCTEGVRDEGTWFVLQSRPLVAAAAPPVPGDPPSIPLRVINGLSGRPRSLLRLRPPARHGSAPCPVRHTPAPVPPFPPMRSRPASGPGSVWNAGSWLGDRACPTVAHAATRTGNTEPNLPPPWLSPSQKHYCISRQ